MARESQFTGKVNLAVVANTELEFGLTLTSVYSPREDLSEGAAVRPEELILSPTYGHGPRVASLIAPLLCA